TGFVGKSGRGGNRQSRIHQTARQGNGIQIREQNRPRPDRAGRAERGRLRALRALRAGRTAVRKAWRAAAHSLRRGSVPAVLGREAVFAVRGERDARSGSFARNGLKGLPLVENDLETLRHARHEREDSRAQETCPFALSLSKGC